MLLALAVAGFVAQASAAQLSLTWVDNSNDESGFKLERATSDMVFSQIAVVGANVTTYTDTGLLSSVAYSYRVCAFNADGNSAYSNVASTTTSTDGNTAPTISDIANTSTDEDSSTGALPFTVGDAESAAGNLLLSCSSSNTALVPNANITFGGNGANRTVRVTPVANQSGTATITVTVSDGALTASDTFVLTVNAVVPANTAPTISNIANQTIISGGGTGALSFSVGDAETAAGSLAVTASSSNTALVPNANIVFGGSGASRTVRVTPAANQTGAATITVTVSDGALTAADTFVLTVNAVVPANTAPTISNIANQTITSGSSTGALSFSVGDAETAAGSLAVSASSSNTALVPNANITFTGTGANRTLTVTPGTNQTGSATITVTVSDGALNSADTFVLTVNAVVPANTAPTISNIADQTIASGSSTGALSFSVGDAETAAGSLAVTASSSNTALVPNANITFGGSGANRTLTVTPAANQSGSATITLTVSDGALMSADTFVLTVNAATPTNTAPTISDIADQTIVSGSSSSTSALSFSVGDAETAAGSLVVAASSSNTALVPNANITFGGSGANRTLTVTPAANQTGTAAITVTVSDGVLTSADTFVLTVNAATPTNTAPTISDIADQTIVSGSGTGALSFSVGDAETAAGSLAVTASSSNTALVPNANITFGGSGANRTLTVTPAANQTGTATITVTVSDGVLTSADTFVLTVNAAAPTNTAPTISDIADQTIVSSTGALAFVIGDAETPAATLAVSASSSNTALVPNANIVFAGSGANRTLTVTPAANQSGAATITVTVSDGALEKTDTFVLTVQAETHPPASNTAPSISSISGAAPNTDGSFGPIALTVGDAETSASSLTVTGTSSNTELVANTNIVLGGSGANRTLTFTPVAGQSGSVSITITVSDGLLSTSTTSTFVVSSSALQTAAELVNLSTRAMSGVGDDVLIHGFVIGGTENRKVLLRAVGPALGAAPFNVQGTMANPRLTLKKWDGTSFVDCAANDDWGTNTNADEIKRASAQVFAFALPDNSLDAAMLVDLPPGQYTVIADSAAQAPGVLIVELYDVGESSGASTLANMSTRGHVGRGDEVLITGFVVSGDTPKKLLIRAVGPTLGLAPYNVANVLTDPKLTVYRSNPDGTDTLVLSQDNWGDEGNASETAATTREVSAFSLPTGSKDAAIATSFAPGVYTVVVSGANDATGVALVEIYSAP